MKDYGKAYKAYDIRSVYEDPVDDTFCYNLGKGIGKHLLETVGEDATLVFASDVREANNELIYRFLKGLEEGGCSNYVGIGMPVETVDEEQQQLWGVASTMMLYYCTKHTFDMGVMFTASHNPPEYVGMKIVNREALLVPSDLLSSLVDTYEPVGDDIDEDDIERIRRAAMGEENKLQYLIEEKVQSLASIYAESFSSIEKTYTIVVDFSNGAGVSYERMFLDEIVAPLGHTLIYINEKADSAFRSHLSDTTNEHDFEQLKAKVLETNADIGLMFDGDGDRGGFVDNVGALVWGDIASGLIAADMLQDEPEKRIIVHDVFFSKAVIEAIEKAGGKPLKSRVGHRFIKELFKEHGALFGGELSGHMFFTAVGGFESPLMALGHIMSELTRHDSFHEAVAPYLRYYKPGLIEYPLKEDDNKEIIFKKIEDTYKQYILDYTDGIGIYADDFWFVLRSSNTVPVLKLVMEADTKEIYDERLVELERLFR